MHSAFTNVYLNVIIHAHVCPFKDKDRYMIMIMIVPRNNEENRINIDVLKNATLGMVQKCISCNIDSKHFSVNNVTVSEWQVKEIKLRLFCYL